MSKYEIKIIFVIEVEAENVEQAEDIGWDWNPVHPEDSIHGIIFPDLVAAKELP